MDSLVVVGSECSCAESFQRFSSQDTFDDRSVNIGQTKVAALMSEGQSLVVDPQTVQNGRVQIVNVHRVFRHVVTEVIRLAVNDPRFDAAAGHPFGVASRMMVATVVCLCQTALAINRASEFAAPNHQSILQHAALFQVVDQRRTGLIHDSALPPNVIGQDCHVDPIGG